MLGPTTSTLLDPASRPYFLWWSEVTVGQLRELLSSSDEETKAYWLGALLREANTRDVWLFTNREEIERMWPKLIRHLGRSRPMWAWLLNLPAEWPPRQPDV